ncbi:RlpA-like double-psi beta-barrel domain-containing protein [Sphingomonas hylomeconis]|uniref:3D domain-containing protein n=1 Tax=Sphingomonas hylomeconis TaxID=1395958 RepID=A0ABV7SQK0_9SPHN|nr:hypothetical protein [Sphingomonas hylomeconis]
MKAHTILIGILTLASSPSAALADDFNLPAPATGSMGPSEKLWSTHYYVSTADTVPNGVEMRARDGSKLGYRVSAERFCFGALQGTVRVRTGANSVVFNANGLTTDSGAKCNYKSLSPRVNARLSRQAFIAVPTGAPHGLGMGGYRLVPYRTIAVDKAHVGRAYFIPALRGLTIDSGVETTPDGMSFVHDGYVFGADVGGAIQYPHIDFFTGFSHLPPPPFVKSSPKSTFTAYRVTDPAIIAKLKKMHAIK